MQRGLGNEQPAPRTKSHRRQTISLHYHATDGLEHGVPLLNNVFRRLGHSSIQTSADVYSYTIQERDRQAVELTAGLLQATAK